MIRAAEIGEGHGVRLSDVPGAGRSLFVANGSSTTRVMPLELFEPWDHDIFCRSG